MEQGGPHVLSALNPFISIDSASVDHRTRALEAYPDQNVTRWVTNPVQEQPTPHWWLSGSGHGDSANGDCGFVAAACNHNYLWEIVSLRSLLEKNVSLTYHLLINRNYLRTCTKVLKNRLLLGGPGLLLLYSLSSIYHMVPLVLAVQHLPLRALTICHDHHCRFNAIGPSNAKLRDLDCHVARCGSPSRRSP